MIRGLLAGLLVLPLLLGAEAARDSVAASHRSGTSGALGQSGTIVGKVEIRKRPQRRKAKRYAGGKVEPPHPVQALPAMAYLVGEIPGGRHEPPVLAQRDTAFVPGVLVVRTGTSVEFPNNDPFFHNVFSYSKIQRFDLGRYPQGESKSVEFDEPGVAKIYCEVHDFMRSAVIVTDNAHHAVVSDDGEFIIEGIPPGTYELVVWHADLDEQRVSVTVPDGGTAEVELTLR